ncbi:MAG: hypothetical protein UZ17_ACD001000336 [Acidobacteria bacterium OLB17]|nr:MAG: hypothetical protein UZ17_ACD001000336 [Acidobacteria bacterium OLB17]
MGISAVPRDLLGENCDTVPILSEGFVPLVPRDAWEKYSPSSVDRGRFDAEQAAKVCGRVASDRIR